MEIDLRKLGEPEFNEQLGAATTAELEKAMQYLHLFVPLAQVLRMAEKAGHIDARRANQMLVLGLAHQLQCQLRAQLVQFQQQEWIGRRPARDGEAKDSPRAHEEPGYTHSVEAKPPDRQSGTG